jgi:activator of 2-hydroxyglutaryl-CoA dehydratase
MLYLDAGTSFSKIMTTENEVLKDLTPVETVNNKNFYIVKSQDLSSLNVKFDGGTGHMSSDYLKNNAQVENEILALAYGIKKIKPELQTMTVLDIGSRDTKWVRFENGKYKELDWNTACASAVGATVEMLLKFYNVKTEDLVFTPEKFNVTCGIFGMEKIMDAISNGENPEVAISKFIHVVAFNAWIFAKKPEKIYLSGGFCENKCFVDSLSKYCEVIPLGRFLLAEGLF